MVAAMALMVASFPLMVAFLALMVAALAPIAAFLALMVASLTLIVTAATLQSPPMVAPVPTEANAADADPIIHDMQWYDQQHWNVEAE